MSALAPTAVQDPPPATERALGLPVLLVQAEWAAARAAPVR